MPTVVVVTFNIADLPWPFENEKLQEIPNRIPDIYDGLAAYDYRLVQEDWFQRMDGLPCGNWWWFPSGLTLGTPTSHPPQNPSCTRHTHSGSASGDWYARKGWQMAHSQGVVWAHTHLDAGDEDTAYRQEQAQDIRDALPDDDKLVLTGDFNNKDTSERSWFDAKFGEVGLTRIPIQTLKDKDHIYQRGLTVLDYGEDANLTPLSNHPAVWAKLGWT